MSIEKKVQALHVVTQRLILRSECFGAMLEGEPTMPLEHELVKAELLELAADTTALCAVVYGVPGDEAMGELMGELSPEQLERTIGCLPSDLAYRLGELYVEAKRRTT